MPTPIRHRSFAPVADRHTRVLVLGSLPGRASLDQRQYYAHRGNQFWRLLSPVTGIDLVPLAYEERLAALLRSGIGLWDVIETAERTGSLDTAIRRPEIRDLPAMIASLPLLRAVAFNGGKSLRHGLRQLGAGCGIEVLALPSSSGMNTSGVAAKQPAWDAIGDFLDPSRRRAQPIVTGEK